MKRIALFSLALLCVQTMVIAQGPPHSSNNKMQLMKGELEHNKALLRAFETASSEDRIDVTYYKLDVTISTA